MDVFDFHVEVLPTSETRKARTNLKFIFVADRQSASPSLNRNRYQSSTGRTQGETLAVFQNDKVRNCSSQSTIVPL